jgi:NADPH:quinone reductase-like Zn-dependent oxidoreductase
MRATMKAIRVLRFGGPEVLALQDVPRPSPGPGEVLVRVRAASVNPFDWKLREGYLGPRPLPFTPGGDFSGVVEALGRGSRARRVGEEVYGCTPGIIGADAEYVVVSEEALAPKPRTLGHARAASVPLVAMTAWQALRETGALRPGETVLILGASGGVGGMAVQLAKEWGARVVGTASTENIRRVEGLGADLVIDYVRNPAIEDQVSGVDLCLDLVGGAAQSRAFNVIRRGGRLVSTVQSPDRELLERRGLSGRLHVTRPHADYLRAIAELVDAGRLKVSVARILPLSRAAEAEELNRRQSVDGKIVLRC